MAIEATVGPTAPTSPTLIMTKPQTLRDIREKHGLSIASLAFEAGVSRHAVMRMEQLCYPSPLPAVIVALSDIDGISEYDLNRIYLSDVKLNRSFGAYRIFGANPLVCHTALDLDSGIRHPFMVWREAVMRQAKEPISRIYFCSTVSVHPATLTNYESFKTGLPKPLEVALLESGVPIDVVAYMRRSPRFNQVVD